jgi:uncharacterized protein YeaO (DUF488 family)
MAGKRKSRAPRARAVAPERVTPGEFSSPACYLHEFTGDPVHTGFAVKRVQEPPSAEDGHRVLVDRLWPRGISKVRAAPSTALRKWYHADLSRWAEFRTRYRAELRAHPAALEPLRERAKQERVTLLYAAHDPQRNHALVLRETLESRPRSTRRPRARARARQT